MRRSPLEPGRDGLGAPVVTVTLTSVVTPAESPLGHVTPEPALSPHHFLGVGVPIMIWVRLGAGVLSRAAPALIEVRVGRPPTPAGGSRRRFRARVLVGPEEVLLHRSPANLLLPLPHLQDPSALLSLRRWFLLATPQELSSLFPLCCFCCLADNLESGLLTFRISFSVTRCFLSFFSLASQANFFGWETKLIMGVKKKNVQEAFV